MVSISTKTGDSGETSLFSGERVRKDHPRLEFIGTIDEADSLLGLARAKCNDNFLGNAILAIQKDLHAISSIVADCSDRLGISPEDILDRFERMEDEFAGKIEIPRSFVYPGGSEVGAIIDIARAVVRRAERILTGMEEKNKKDMAIMPVVNRLSDLLWLMARYADSHH